MDETFDPLQYIASYEDLIRAFGTDTAAATQHYITQGQFEGRRPDLFDQEQYLRNYADLQGAFGTDGNAATLHYITNGFSEGRTDRIIGFDGLQYIASYQDLIDAFGPDPAAAEQHYIAFGRAEGRSIDDFDERQYLINYPDLAAAFSGNAQAATLHYIVAGAGEGRTDGPIPRPVDDAVTVAEDSGTVRFTVTGNDGSSAPGGGALTLVDLGTAGTVGDVDVLRSGRIAYDPIGAFESLAEGQTATDSFTYTVRNADGQIGTARVTVTIAGANDAPVAAADQAATNEDAVQQFRVLDNDGDVDAGANLTVSDLGTSGTVGVVSIAADGKSVIYDPTGRFDLAGGVTAIDSFTYTVSDGQGGSDTETVTVTVTGVGEPPPPPPPPVANDDAFTVGEDSGINRIAVLANDTDADGSPRGISLASIDTSATIGSVETTTGGRILYEPSGMFEALGVGQSAADTFTYTIINAAGAQDSATVNVTISGANDDPTASADTGAIAENQVIALAVLNNDTDIDTGTDLSISELSTRGTIGAVSIAADGKSVNYDPTGRFDLAGGVNATDSFTYTVSDGQGGSDTETVTVTVTGVDEPPPPTPTPVAADDAFTVGEDFRPFAFRPLANDTDADGSPSGLTLLSVDTTGTIGSVETTSGGRIVYDPDDRFENLTEGAIATDSFAYSIRNAAGGVDTATVTVTIVGDNDDPIAVADVFQIEENAGPTFLAVTGGDSDVDDGASLTVASVDSTGTLGTVAVAPDGINVIYTPGVDVPDGETLEDVFSYTVSDGVGGEDTATVTVTILGVPSQVDPATAAADFLV